MPKFRVHYKTRYRHMSQGGHHDFEAASDLEAVKRFFTERRAELEDEGEDSNQLPDPVAVSLSKEYSWSEGEYLVELRGVEMIDLVECPLCHGLGELSSSALPGYEGRPSDN